MLEPTAFDLSPKLSSRGKFYLWYVATLVVLGVVYAWLVAR